MSASAFAKTLPQSLSSRTVLVKCTPAPRGLAERRAILKGLQMTGLSPEIEVFRRLDDSSSFIAVTAAAGTARNLVDDSPFHRVVITAPVPAWGGAALAAGGSLQQPQIAEPVVVQSLKKMEKNVKKKSTWWRRRIAAQEKEAAEKQAAKELSEKAQLQQQQLEAGDAAAAGQPPAGPIESLPIQKKEFTIHVFPANQSFSHQRMLGRGLLHGPWPLAINPFASSKEAGHQDQAELRDTFVSAALRKSVPPGRLAPSLKDWDTGRQMAVGRGTAASFDDRAAWELLGGGVHGAAFIQARLHKKRIAAETPAVMRSLAAVARQGQRQRERWTSYGRGEEGGEAGFGQRDDFG